MIGNHHAWGRSGYTILEEGEIDPATLELKVAHYLICRPDGSQIPGVCMTLLEARGKIEAFEAGD